mmetsp:Transcript_19974/g.49041  ORF Transcript_19974/g.49041 Transcript_19974/m.49041 type:complete len:771 (-) Transcript_19974:602-2914(-)
MDALATEGGGHLMHHARALLAGGGGDFSFTFEELLYAMIMLCAVWVGGAAVKAMGSPDLVGWVIVGILMGPNLAHVVPKPDSWMLIGEVGLLLLVLEAGLDVDLKMIRLMGARAVAVALLGSLTPLAIGIGLASALGLPWMQALVVGTVLAPTSVGIALNVLKAGKVLHTQTGQLVIAAAILDDIIALVLLSELEALENPTAMAFAKPVLVALGLLVGIGSCAIMLVPKFLEWLLPRIPEQHRDNLMLGLIFLTALGFIPGVHYAGGSHLLGAFLAGLCFCTDSHAHHAWITQVKRIMHWLIMVFFACTVGFEIPITELFKADVIKTAAVFLVALAGKILTGFWATPLNIYEFCTVGFAMSAWGEFAFVVATTAKEKDLIDRDTFSACTLAVLVSVFLGPLLLKMTLKAKKKHDERLEEEFGPAEVQYIDIENQTPCADPNPLYYKVSVKCQGLPGQVREVLSTAMGSLSCDIVDMRCYHPSTIWGWLQIDLVLMDRKIELPTGQSSKTEWEMQRELVRAAFGMCCKHSSATIDVERWYPGLWALEDSISSDRIHSGAKKTVFEHADIVIRKTFGQNSEAHKGLLPIRSIRYDAPHEVTWKRRTLETTRKAILEGVDEEEGFMSRARKSLDSATRRSLELGRSSVEKKAHKTSDSFWSRPSLSADGVHKAGSARNPGPVEPAESLSPTAVAGAAALREILERQRAASPPPQQSGNRRSLDIAGPSTLRNSLDGVRPVPSSGHASLSVDPVPPSRACAYVVRRSLDMERPV